MAIFSTNKKSTEKLCEKNCLQEDDDGKNVFGDICLKKMFAEAR